MSVDRKDITIAQDIFVLINDEIVSLRTLLSFSNLELPIKLIKFKII